MFTERTCRSSSPAAAWSFSKPGFACRTRAFEEEVDDRQDSVSDVRRQPPQPPPPPAAPASPPPPRRQPPFRPSPPAFFRRCPAVFAARLPAFSARRAAARPIFSPDAIDICQARYLVLPCLSHRRNFHVIVTVFSPATHRSHFSMPRQRRHAA